MALAEKLHHTSRGQRFARAGEEGREEHDALRRQRPPSPQPELFQLYEEEPGGSRPACLVAPRGPQEAVQRHTVEQPKEVHHPNLSQQCRSVQDLHHGNDVDAPALDELVIAVPKFYLPRIPQRCPRRRPRRAEQLVEVPTIISYSSLQQRIAEQLIDILVPHDRGGRGGGRGLLGFSQGQNSTANLEQNVDIPARGGLHGFLPGQREFKGGFRTFSRPEKSATFGPHSGSELSADFTPSTPAACVDSIGPLTWVDDAGFAWWQSESGRWFLDRDPSIWWDAPG